ncbi:MAG TPA: SRPBCC domain-containing protein [Acidimicrobiia bacterium]|nr:SRPBCC domain-containing protein [Acidimicrobiia bacterium]
MTDRIVVEFEVRTPVEHAFEMWTERCALWWPRSHSMSQSDGFEVVFEPFAGGRIHERGADGSEHEWGEVIVWEPPRRLEYWWHIFLDRDRATRVTVTFTPTDDGTTAVRLVNSGFEVFGDAAPDRIERVGGAWHGITQHYRDTLAAESS